MTSLRARALLIGERLDLRALETTERLAISPLTLPVPDHGIVMLFRYGVVVFVNVSPMEEASFLARLQPFASDPYKHPESETLEIRIDPSTKESMQNERLVIHDASIERLQVVAEVLAKSVVLSAYESRIAETFDRIEPLAAKMQRTGRGAQGDRELVSHIGSTLLSLHRMVGRVAVGEKPDLLWERPDLELPYMRLLDEFEVEERQLALERKLEVISRTAQSLLDLLQAKRSLRVEWYIVILIMVEILLSLYALFLHPGGGH